MVNEIRKRAFVCQRKQELNFSDKSLERQFNKVAKVEEHLGKDLADFTKQEILQYYCELQTSSLMSLYVIHSQFSLYAEWCQKRNFLRDKNEFLYITKEDIQGCINRALLAQQIIEGKRFVKLIDILPNPKDQFVLLGLFEGMKGDNFCELANLRPENIKGRVACLCTGRQISISKKLQGIIYDCIEESKYYSISGERRKTMPLLDRGYIIKDYPNTKSYVSEFQKGRKIYNGVTRSLKYLGFDDGVRANNVSESGKLYMIKQRAKDLNLTERDYIYSDYILEVEEKFNCKIVRSIFMDSYKDYLDRAEP